MDDSFNDFKEKKKCKIGPKIVQKSKNRQKKPLKPSKGQKDIRSLIKKNEIVSYSRDFNEVCKQSGIDVDSEQLQLAIALSKSLDGFQSSAGSTSEVEEQNKLSSQERTAKIRSTLQEYGFKVNGSKVAFSLPTNKRKKYSKSSKLLKISNEERQIKISDRYAQILARSSQNLVDITNCNYSKHEIFHKSTNITYNKDNDIFYVPDLVEKAKHKSCLLRNWSEIPGRPVSPELSHNNVDFDAIQCSQQDLDEVLSGSIDIAQSIIRKERICKENTKLEHCNNKTMELTKCVETNIAPLNSGLGNNFHENAIHNDKVIINCSEMDIDNDKLIDNETPEIIICEKDVDIYKNVKETTVYVNDSINKNLSKTSNYQSSNEVLFRSASPDLFEDECSIMDKNESIIENRTKIQTVFMDLTQLDNNFSTQKSNSTNTKNDDIIEITECVDYNHENTNYDTNKTKSIEVIDITGNTNKIMDIGSNFVGIQSDLTDEGDQEMIELMKLPNIDLGNKNRSLEREVVSNGSTSDELNISKLITNEDKSNNSDNNTNDCIVSDVATTQRNQQSINGSEKYDDENMNIDLTQDLVLNEGDFSGHDFVNENCDNLNNTCVNDISLKSVKDNHLENTIDINDHCELENSNDSTIILDNDNDNNVQTGISDRHLENSNDNNVIQLNDHANHSTVILDDDDHDNDKNGQTGISNHRHLENSNDNNVIQLNHHDNDHANHSTVILDDDYDNDKNVQIRNNDHCELEQLNRSIIIIDYDNDVSLDRITPEKSLSLHNDMEIQGVDDHCIFENLGCNSHILANDNDDIISLNSQKSNNIYDKEGDVDLTQGSEKSFGDKDQISYRNIVNNVEDVQNQVDLTQVDVEINQNNSRLGKIDNISIDYDGMFDEIMAQSKSSNKNSSKEASGQNSEKFDLSDKELNYSIRNSIYENIDNDCEDIDLPAINLSQRSPVNDIIENEARTPVKIYKELLIQTPDNDEYIVKTGRVTPMPEYDAMTTPERNEELDKYGLKPFKRKRAIQLLTYIYNQTHPIIQYCSPEEGPSKKFKSNKEKTPKKISPKSKSPNKKSPKPKSPKRKSPKPKSPKKKSPKPKTPKKCLDFGSECNEEKDIYGVTSEEPDIKNVECDPKDWIFQTKEKAKMHSCRVPLHIAFHNYVSCRKMLRESILKYEPINIDIIHKQLVSYGYKYNPKDLLKFMDKKCITVKTFENNSRNKKT